MKPKLCASLHFLLLDKTNEVKSGEGKKLIQRFLQFSFPLRNQLLLPYPKIIGGQKIQSCEFSFANRFWIESPSCEEGSKLWPCSLAMRPPLRNDESRRDAGSPCILCPALTRSKCRLQALRWYEVERRIYRVRNPSVRHKTPSCASTAWTKYESLCTPSDGTALIAIDVN